MYDQFLAFLSGHFQNTDKWIVDIGANVGDTAFGFRGNSVDSILAVEPNKVYYELLKKNMKCHNIANVILDNCFVSDCEDVEYVSNMHDGTAFMSTLASEGESKEAPTYTLKHLLQRHGLTIDTIDLIKVDTDGFDAQCILSGEDIFSEASCLVYFENYLEDNVNYSEYMKMYDYLWKNGYKMFYIFDNYGNYICKGDKETIESLNRYLYRNVRGTSALTFAYFDVLACKEDMVKVCNEIVAAYQKQYE